MLPTHDPKSALALGGGLLVVLRLLRKRIPADWQPEVGALVGLLLSVVDGLASGMPVLDAVDHAILYSLVGLAGGHAASRWPAAGPSASDGDAGKGSGTSAPPSAPKAKPGSTELPRVAWALGVLLVWAIGGCLVAACTASERQTAATVASVAVPVCDEGVVIAGAPELAPLCATLPEIEAAIAQLIAEHQPSADAGVMARAWHPSAAAVHRKIVQMRAERSSR